MWFSIITDVELGSEDKQNPEHKVVECFLGHAPTAVKLSSQLQNCPSPPPLTVVSSRICATLPPDVPILSSHEDNQSNAPLCHFFARKSDNGGLPRICKAQFGRRYCCVTSDSNLFFHLFSFKFTATAPPIQSKRAMLCCVSRFLVI